MKSRLIAAWAAIVTAGAASASISAYLGPAQFVTLSVGQAAYADVHIEVSPGDSWTVGRLHLTASRGYFYQDALDANPPNPLLFGLFPDLEFTSFYTSPGDWPNTAYNGSVVNILETNDSPTVLDTDWFDTIDGEGAAGGDFVVARITLVGGGVPGSLTDGVYGEFRYASRENTTIQTLRIVPEPAGFALLVLGGLVVARRR